MDGKLDYAFGVFYMNHEIEIMHLPIEIEDENGNKEEVDHAFYLDFETNPILVYPVYDYHCEQKRKV